MAGQDGLHPRSNSLSGSELDICDGHDQSPEYEDRLKPGLQPGLPPTWRVLTAGQANTPCHRGELTGDSTAGIASIALPQNCTFAIIRVEIVVSGW
jgi:hypothetical protein